MSPSEFSIYLWNAKYIIIMTFSNSHYKIDELYDCEFIYIHTIECNVYWATIIVLR